MNKINDLDSSGARTKVLLAYSGGLDTTYCARFLAVDLNMEVHTVLVDTGGFSNDEIERIEKRAAECGVASHITLDRRQDLFNDVLRYCIAGNVLKNAAYPLSVSAERVVQAIAIADYALAIDADCIAHGSTGAGNDQIRFDVIFRILCPGKPIITPIRDNKLSRQQEISYLESHGMEGDWTKATYSINQGIWGTTIGGVETLTSQSLPDDVVYDSSYKPNLPVRKLTIQFEAGVPVGIDGKIMDPVSALQQLNAIGLMHGVGRGLHVGDTILGIKGRIVFEAPAALLLIEAHRLLEKHTLTKWQLMLKDQMAAWYGQLLHEGQFLEPAMRNVEAMFESSQERVSGAVTLELGDKWFRCVGINSEFDLMNNSIATYGESNQGWSGEDVRGFATIASISSAVHASLQTDTYAEQQ